MDYGLVKIGPGQGITGIHTIIDSHDIDAMIDVYRRTT
jgi:hypothetical protein